MRAAVSVGLFCVLWLFGTASDAELQRHYPGSGFSAAFSGDVKEIDLKPSDQTRDYISNTSIYEQNLDGASFSVTAREYRYGIPNLRGLAAIIEAQLRCATVKRSPLDSGGLSISGERCLSTASKVFVRLLARGRWFYQALAVVPEGREVDGAKFVAALKLTATRKQYAPPKRIKQAKKRTRLVPIARSKLRLRHRSHLVRSPAPGQPATANAGFGYGWQQNASQQSWWTSQASSRPR